MMSSYASLPSMSPAADWAFVDADDDMATVSSYLSFDTDVGEEECCHPPEAAEAAFRSEPRGQAPLFGMLQGADSDYCVSGEAGGYGGEAGKQSLLDVLVVTPAGLASHDTINDNESASTGGGGCARSLPRSKSGKIAFKTRSDVDVLDDGYHWRKYGKKMVKNSPNPRNYYRCSSEGCRVKKRVERERDDARFVITTYDGVHNHPAAPQPPSRVYRLGELRGS